MKRLLVEGWRDIHHSYSIVNQCQMRALARRPDIELYFSELPLYRGDWKRSDSSAPGNNRIRDIPAPPKGMVPDAVYRIAFPYPISPGIHGEKIFVFGTSEWRHVSPDMITGGMTLEEALQGNDVQIVTPSQWSKRGFVASGAPVDRVHVVPHGVDTKIFHPDKKSRNKARKMIGIGSNEFLFLSIGAMTENKGIGHLLRAFAILAEQLPNIRLVLKGADFLYPSGDHFYSELEHVSTELRNRILPRVAYVGGDFSFHDMANLYRSADAYVTPYQAEGFNLPALEAMACGIPVICTQGGPTDDFRHPEISLPVRSIEKVQGDEIGLEPELDHLIEQMKTVYHDETIRSRAAKAGPEWVRQKYTWERVTDRLVSFMFDAPGG